MGLLIHNHLPVINQTIFIKVAVRQQMWAQLDKSLLLSGTTLCSLPLCSRQSQKLRKHRMEQGERNGYCIATDGNPSTQLSQKLEGRYFISSFLAGALFFNTCSFLSFKLNILDRPWFFWQSIFRRKILWKVCPPLLLMPGSFSCWIFQL